MVILYLWRGQKYSISLDFMMRKTISQDWISYAVVVGNIDYDDTDTWGVSLKIFDKWVSDTILRASSPE